jgi:iron complex transport system substrate-binding protein
VRSPSRRLGARMAAAMAALALATGLAACGNGAETKENPGSKAAAGSGFPRTVTHHKGTATLQARPERIVALDPSLVEATLAIGGTLVGGVGSYGDAQTFPPYLGDSVKGVEKIGPLESPNLEGIAALEPDLIVSASIRHDALYDELSKIAPTVFVQTTGPTWKANITKLGEAIGAEKQAADALAAYEKRAAAVGKAINEKAGNPEISVVRFLDGPTRLMGNASFTGIILSDMGLARPKAQDIDEFTVEVGEEQIRLADGDYIFVSTFEGGDESRERFRRNPLWRQLGGVRQNKVHDVNDATWMLSVSLQGATIVLDDMAKIFGVDPQR